MSTRAVLVVAALVAAFVAYRAWNSDERQILRLLDAVAQTVSHDEPSAGVGALAEVAALTTYLAPDVTIDPGPPGPAMAGAQDVVSAAARLRVATPMLRLAFVDVQVSDAEGGTARVQATVSLTMRSRDGGDVVDAREVVIDVRRIDGRWVIAAARAVPAIEPVR